MADSFLRQILVSEERRHANIPTGQVDRILVFTLSILLQCNDGTSNKVSNMFGSHIDNRKLLLICILLLSHTLIFLRFIFYQYMVVFLFNTVIYLFLL